MSLGCCACPSWKLPTGCTGTTASLSAPPVRLFCQSSPLCDMHADNEVGWVCLPWLEAAYRLRCHFSFSVSPDVIPISR